MKGVFDSNILVDYLNGYAAAAEEFQCYSQALINHFTRDAKAFAPDSATVRIPYQL